MRRLVKVVREEAQRAGEERASHPRSGTGTGRLEPVSEGVPRGPSPSAGGTRFPPRTRGRPRGEGGCRRRPELALTLRGPDLRVAPVRHGLGGPNGSAAAATKAKRGGGGERWCSL